MLNRGTKRKQVVELNGWIDGEQTEETRNEEEDFLKVGKIICLANDILNI